MHAIASAGVAFAVTRSCAEGSAAICGCSSRHQGLPGEGWKWGGCSEDIEFGGMVSREFADARENRPDARSAMNRHNNEAGRQVQWQLLAGSGGVWSGAVSWGSWPACSRVQRGHPSRPCASCRGTDTMGSGDAPSDNIPEVLGNQKLSELDMCPGPLKGGLLVVARLGSCSPVPGLCEMAQSSCYTRVEGSPTRWQGGGLKACPAGVPACPRRKTARSIQHCVGHCVIRKGTHKVTWAPQRGHTPGWHLKKKPSVGSGAENSVCKGTQFSRWREARSLGAAPVLACE